LSYRVIVAESASEDLNRLYDFLLERDVYAAERAMDAMDKAFAFLQDFPVSCRKAESDNPLLRELVIPFGGAGYIALFEIADNKTVFVLAVRHQREDDYH
jgi:plasmid stabilization system protein ParE